MGLRSALAALPLLACSLSAAPRAGGREKALIRVISPAAEAATDGDSCPLVVAVSTGAGIAVLDVVRKTADREERLRLPVKDGRAEGEAALDPGRNLFTVSGADARGRRIRGASFRVFRTSTGAPEDGAPPLPSTAPLPNLQPIPVPAPKPPPAPPAEMRRYGPGRCGFAPYARMSIPVTDKNGTHYVDFKTDGNGCLPSEVEVK